MDGNFFWAIINYCTCCSLAQYCVLLLQSKRGQTCCPGCNKSFNNRCKPEKCDQTAVIKVNTEGLLETVEADPPTEDDINMSDLSKAEENALLMPESNSEESANEEEIQNGQANPETADIRPWTSKQKHSDRDTKRPRTEKSAKTNHESIPAHKDDRDISSVKGKIKGSEEALVKLQKHLDEGSCPKTLRYKARANIVPDEEFKKEISAIRKRRNVRSLAHW